MIPSHVEIAESPGAGSRGRSAHSWPKKPHQSHQSLQERAQIHLPGGFSGLPTTSLKAELRVLLRFPPMPIPGERLCFSHLGMGLAGIGCSGLEQPLAGARGEGVSPLQGRRWVKVPGCPPGVFPPFHALKPRLEHSRVYQRSQRSPPAFRG